MLSTADLTLLQQIWNQTLQQARKTGGLSTREHREAFTIAWEFYRFLGRGTPYFGAWMHTQPFLFDPPVAVGRPLVLKNLYHAVMHAFPRDEQTQIQSMMGWNANLNMFNMAANTPLAFPLTFPGEGRRQQRPNWARSCINFLTWFDAPSLALFTFARRRKLALPETVIETAERIEELLRLPFGIVLFEGGFLLLDRPEVISFDQNGFLSSQTGPAFSTGRANPCNLYAINGVVLTRRKEFSPKEVDLRKVILARTPRLRLALIAYMGWEGFLKAAKTWSAALGVRARLVDKSTYGELWDIECPTSLPAGLADYEIFRVVKVFNSTPDPITKKRKPYVLPVDFELRPLPNPNDPMATFGTPQRATALNAVASTFGLTGAQFEVGDEA